MDNIRPNSTLPFNEESVNEKSDKAFNHKIWYIRCGHPIIKAVALDNIRRVRILLERKKSVHTVASVEYVYYYSPLHVSLFNQNLDIINLLLSHPDVKLESKNYLGETPLMLSIGKVSNAVVSRLLDAGCDVNTRDNAGRTPLHVALNCHRTIVKELIRRGANLNTPCGCAKGVSALFHAINTTNLELLYMLLYYNADTTVTDSNGLTPFLYSLDYYFDRTVAYELLPYVVDFSLTDARGLNCLSLAIEKKHPIVKDILQVIDNKSLNQVDYQGNSALFYSLVYEEGILFQELFSIMDHNILFKSPNPIFAAMLLSNNLFSHPSWVKAFYLFASSNIFAISLQDSLIFLNELPLFEFITNEYNFAAVRQKDRLKIICILLSYGVKVYFDDIVGYYNKFGPCEELNVLLSSKIYGYEPTTCSPFLSYIFGREERMSYVDLEQNILREILHSRCYKRIKTILRYFTLPYADTELCLECQARRIFVIRNQEYCRIPTLMELCRNEVRLKVRNDFGITTANEFYETVKKMYNLPREIKHFILFQIPLSYFTVIY